MSIKLIFDMPLRKAIHSLRWFMHAPRQRREYLSSRTIRDVAGHTHISTELRIQGSVTLGNLVNIGKHTVITVQADGHLICGDNAWLGDNCEIDASGIVEVGANSSLQHRTILLGEVSIGAGCLFGPNIYISSGQHRFEDNPALPIRWQDARFHAISNQIGRPVHIGEDCWIGTNVVIMPGVNIGRGCIVGANSTVTRDAPPYSVIAGSPARILRTRLDFVPPSELHADREDHFPYFYSGFRLWGNGISSLKEALHKGGWLTKNRFSLAMAVENGDDCELQIMSSTPGTLRHGNSLSISVSPGESTIHFQALLNPYGILEFSWSELQPGEPAGLVILCAKKCQRIA